MSFSAQEKKAAAAVTAIGLFIAYAVFDIGKRNFWFEAKNLYYTHIKDADGLRIGSVVSISGLRVGEVSALDVDEQNHIVATLKVRRTVASRLRADSVAQVIRTFIIGEKRIDLQPGSNDQAELANGATLPGKDTTDLAEFLTGKKLAELMGQIDGLIGGLTAVVTEMNSTIGKYHAGEFTKTLTLVEPALTNFLKLSDDLIVMTKEVKKKSKELPALVDNGATVLGDLHQDFFANHLAEDTVRKVNQVVTPLASREQLISQLLGNLSDLSKDLSDNPKFGKKVLEAVQELTVTLKALQKTWILEDKAEAVKEESSEKPAASP